MGYQKLRELKLDESSAEVRTRMEVARERLPARFEGTDITSHADRRPAQIRQYCALNKDCQTLMKTAMRQL